jgi:hypothetical protein
MYAKDGVFTKSIGSAEVDEIFSIKSADTSVGAKPNVALVILKRFIYFITGEPIVGVECPEIGILSQTFKRGRYCRNKQ